MISLVRGILRRKCHIEHVMKEPIQYVADVADRHLVIEIFDRVRCPECMSVAQGKELIPVNIAGRVYWHDGRKSVPVGVVVRRFWRSDGSTLFKIRFWPRFIEITAISIIA